MTTGNENDEERERLWHDKFCDGIIKFLVDGLMSRQQQVKDRCAEVLIAFGSDAVDRLNLILQTGELSSTHRKRVKAVLTSAKAADGRSPLAGAMLLGSILFMIEQNEMELVKPGLRLSRYLLRQAMTNFLVDAAVDHQSDSEYFDRLLRAVEFVAEKPGKLQIRQLVTIYYEDAGSISQSCKRLLAKIESGEIGDQWCPGGLRQHHLTLEDLSKWPDSSTPFDPFPEVSDSMWQKGYHYLPDLAPSATD